MAKKSTIRNNSRGNRVVNVKAPGKTPEGVPNVQQVVLAPGEERDDLEFLDNDPALDALFESGELSEGEVKPLDEKQQIEADEKRFLADRHARDDKQMIAISSKVLADPLPVKSSSEPTTRSDALKPASVPFARPVAAPNAAPVPAEGANTKAAAPAKK